MKIWHEIFVAAFVLLYGGLSVALLGSWLRDALRVLTGGPRPASRTSLHPAPSAAREVAWYPPRHSPVPQ